MTADADFLRDVEDGSAVFLQPRPSPVSAPPACSTWVRPLGVRLDDRLGTSPLFDLVLGKRMHGHWQQIVAVVTVLGWMTRPAARQVMRSRRVSWRARVSGTSS